MSGEKIQSLRDISDRKGSRLRLRGRRGP
jgi:hypothetical protein